MEREKSDSQLITEFLAGNEQGFEELVKRYQGYVINIVYSLSGDAEYADDIAQEVFIKVYRNLGSFRQEASFSTWLYRITVNTAYNYLKSRKRYVPLDNIPEIPKVETLPATELEYKEKQEIIKNAIAKLPFKYRTVVALKDIEGLSYEEIAGILNCSIGTVESRLFRARAILKNTLLPMLKKEDTL